MVLTRMKMKMMMIMMSSETVLMTLITTKKDNDCGQLKKERKFISFKGLSDAHFGKLHSRVSVVFTEVTGTH